MARRLRLTRYATENVNYLRLGTYRLKVTCTDPDDTGADPNVFLFLARPLGPDETEPTADFHAVAGPADLAQYPAGEPDDSTTYPFFRHHTFVLDMTSTALADYAWTVIVREVGVLLEAMNRLDEMTVVAEVDVGAPAGGGSGSSESASA